MNVNIYIYTRNYEGDFIFSTYKFKFGKCLFSSYVFSYDFILKFSDQVL
jgi:hypothetical protein